MAAAKRRQAASAPAAKRYAARKGHLVNAEELINWFWRQFRRHRDGNFGPDSLCQCGTEILIERCDNPDQMRAFLLVSVAINQEARYLPEKDYQSFHELFRFPRIKLHGPDSGDASADWVISEHHGFHKKMNWPKGAEIAFMLIPAVSAWFMSDPVRSEVWPALAEKLRWLPQKFAEYDDASAALVKSLLERRQGGESNGQAL